MVGYNCTLALCAVVAACVAVSEQGAAIVLQLRIDLSQGLDSYNATLHRGSVDWRIVR